jgi:hypothetical protein
LIAQQAGFNDSVVLKNGTVLENVKATVTKDSLVITQSDGTTFVYPKNEVSEVIKNGKAKGPEKFAQKSLESGNKDFFAKVSPEDLKKFSETNLIHTQCKVYKKNESYAESIKQKCLIALSGAFSNPNISSKEILYGTISSLFYDLSVKAFTNQEFIKQINNLLVLADKQVESEEGAVNSLEYLKRSLKNVIIRHPFIKAVVAGDKNYFSKIKAEEFKAVIDSVMSKESVFYDICSAAPDKCLDSLVGVFTNPDTNLKDMVYGEISNVCFMYSDKPAYKKNLESFIAKASSKTDSENTDAYANMMKNLRETLETMKTKKK